MVGKFLLKAIQRPPWSVWALLVILGVFGLFFWVLYPFSMTEVSTSERLGHDGMTLGLDLKGGTHLIYMANLEGVEDKEQAVDGAIDIIRKRIDKFGVTEPVIQKQGDDLVVVQLPGVEDVNQAKQLIGEMAELEFYELQAQVGGDLFWDPSSRIWFPVNDGEGEYIWVPATADDPGDDSDELVALTGGYLKPNEANSTVITNEQGLSERAVQINFDSSGSEMFEVITTRNVNKPLAMFLDGELMSAPNVNEIIDGGVGYITGAFSEEDADLLAMQLNSGALPVQLGRESPDDPDVFETGMPMFEDTVSPTLGQEFVERSVIALLIGLGLVMLFMMLYYRLPGVLASLALMVYVIVVLGIFKLFPVTLTLAGIGGFVLSIGMAVDANVLIFERMREELRTGRTLKAAINAGFKRAWTAIWVSNVSTLIVCLILYLFGNSIVESPPVVGFATTLAIGVTVSMLSAIGVTRTFLSFFTGARAGRRVGWFGIAKARA
ncbi:MAG: protein translocase subunit SecD [Chloroflexota bacterium]|nr:protein translocase subunit SecD [Chloroflexota bacterium]